MNAIRSTQALNKLELENAVAPSASWHADYRDTAYVYIGGLPLDLSEGDVIAIFSQYGNPTHLNLVREKDTGKSRGFAFLKYEDQRSCDLAVDNLGGAQVLGRLLRVDHTRYKKKDGEDEDTWRIERLEEEEADERDKKRGSDTEGDSEAEKERRKRRRRLEDSKTPMLKEERELEEMLAIKQDGEEEDPMREYLIREKREEVERAKERRDKGDGERKHRHHHHRRRDEGRDRDRDRNKRGDERRTRRHGDVEGDGVAERSSKDDRRKRRDVDDEGRGSRRDRDRRGDDVRMDVDVDLDDAVEKNRRLYRSRSPEDRERRRRDRSRDRDAGDSDKERRHRRRDYEGREDERRRRSP